MSGRVDVTMYHVEKVESSRTHTGTIDIELDQTRIFLTDEQGSKLAAAIMVSLATPLHKPAQKASLTPVFDKLYKALVTDNQEEAANGL